jgi:hypothetical protein
MAMGVMPYASDCRPSRVLIIEVTAEDHSDALPSTHVMNRSEGNAKNYFLNNLKFPALCSQAQSHLAAAQARKI